MTTERCCHPNAGPDLEGITSESDALLALAMWEESARTDDDPFALPTCPDCGERVGFYVVRREEER